MKVIFSDLDGTLLNKDRNLSTNTKSIISKFISQGGGLILSTGRHYLDAINFKNELGYDGYIISSNGAKIYKNSNCVYESYIEPELIDDIVFFLTKFNVNLHFYTSDKWVTNKEDKERIKFHKGEFTYEIKEISEFPKDKVEKIFVINKGDNSILDEVNEILSQHFIDKLNISKSNAYCLEMTSKMATKGNAVNWVVNKLGIDISDTIAFGDAMNDLSMLKAVGTPVVMGNALPELKHKFPKESIILKNDDDGVALYIDGFILNKEK